MPLLLANLAQVVRVAQRLQYNAIVYRGNIFDEAAPPPLQHARNCEVLHVQVR